MLKLKQLCRRALIAVCTFCTCGVLAQNNLSRNITVNIKGKKIADLLTIIGEQGGFYFAYGNNLVATDSVVTVSASNKTVRTLLDDLFNGKVDYKETPGYIILRPAPYRLSVYPDSVGTPDNLYIISGYVVDDNTGKKLANASVYEKSLLISTLTDQNGFFKLKIKHAGALTLTVSKEMYRDTSVNLLSDIAVYSKPRSHYYYSADTAYSKLERGWFGRLFISSKQKIQGINLGGFVSSVPVQTSLTPGLSSQGMMSSQLVNHLSLNIIGGYTAGVNGVELAGVFNIDKGDVKQVQAAGVLNLVGGDVRGVELAGVGNHVYKDVKGFQAAGVYNVVRGKLSGVQMSGVLNRVKDSVSGVQVAGVLNTSKIITGAQMAGILNYTKQNSKGFQIAGIGNITGGEAKGFQMAGLFNKARTMKGVHFSIVNIADTLDGCAIGLISFSKNGYHQLSAYTDETFSTNLSYKSGNKKLYTRLIGGANLTDSVRYFSYGLAIGHDFILNKNMVLSAEASSITLRSGSWKNQHQLNRVSALLNIKAGPKVSFFAGPSFTLYHDLGDTKAPTEQAQITRDKLLPVKFNNNLKGWLGFSAGITLF
ncbi:hypothetical protein GCM10023149_38310 [Mucilaginibacter gynuensis]|uniref:Carboxypeptidase-like protein n=1 Tax=Mucilaginibacter gynuensis TaxID=1302236 RepID=A0ABP8GZE4_9SPHI